MKTDATIAPVMQRDSHHAFHIDPDKFDSSLQFLEDKGVEIILLMRERKSCCYGSKHIFP